MPKVVCQPWESSERTPGWGVDIRDEGFSVHKNKEHLEAFIKAHWATYEEKSAPDYYVRPAGDPYIVNLRSNSKLYQKLLKTRKKGIRSDGKAPKGFVEVN